MKSFYIEKKLPFNQEMLLSRWAEINYKVKTDSVFAFSGENEIFAPPKSKTKKKKAETEYKEIDEKQKSKNTEHIPNMLHFRIEHHNLSKTEGILRQWLLATIITNALGSEGFSRNAANIFFFNSQLSIATIVASPFSCVLHTALFIDPSTSPLKEAGLDDFDIPIKDFAIQVMHEYKNEITLLESLSKKTGIILS